MVEKKITAIMIIEVAGRPPQYLIDSMKAHVDKLNHIKGVSLVRSRISEPAVVESEKDLHTCFAEVEVQTDGLAKLMDLMFDFMPSSVEIIEPVDLQLNCQEATMFMNDLSGRLHKYDEVTKIMQMQMQQLAQKLQATQQPANRPAQSMIQPVQISMQQEEKDSRKKVKKAKKVSKKK